MEPSHILEATWSLWELVPSQVIWDKFIQQIFTAYLPSARHWGRWVPLSGSVPVNVKGFISLPCFNQFPCLRAHMWVLLRVIEVRQGIELGSKILFWTPQHCWPLGLKKQKQKQKTFEEMISLSLFHCYNYSPQRHHLNVNFKNLRRNAFSMQIKKIEERTEDLFNHLLILKNSVSINYVEVPC